MHLRELNLADAPRCAELEKQLFPGESPWPEKVFTEAMGLPHAFYFGVEDASGLLVGYAGIAMMGPAADPEFEIHTIGTDPAFQRRGIARMMMDNICHIADLRQAPVFLEVRVGNDPAVRLYEKYGFVHLGVRRNYYQPSGADAYTMRRPAAGED